jgi:hypothetical protein
MLSTASHTAMMRDSRGIRGAFDRPGSRVREPLVVVVTIGASSASRSRIRGQHPVDLNTQCVWTRVARLCLLRARLDLTA